MNMRIYGHPMAEKRAITLWRELSQFPWRGSSNNRAIIDRTTGDESKYPNVYKVRFAAGHWITMDREKANWLFDLADKYGCNVRINAPQGKFEVLFEDAGTGRNKI